jgi:hypothetical protein
MAHDGGMPDQVRRRTYPDAATPGSLPQGFSDPLRSDFNRLADAAARLGRGAIPGLMLAARDGRTLQVQLCAIKALGMIPHPVALEARRRISLLPLDGERGRIVRGAFPDRIRFDQPWDLDAVIASFIHHDDYASAHRFELFRLGCALRARATQLDEQIRIREAWLADAPARRAEAKKRRRRAEELERMRLAEAEQLRRRRQEEGNKREALAREFYRLRRAREEADRARRRLDHDQRTDAQMADEARLAELRRAAPRLRAVTPRPVPASRSPSIPTDEPLIREEPYYFCTKCGYFNWSHRHD